VPDTILITLLLL